MYLRNKLKVGLIILISTFSCIIFGQSNSKFKVVLDAGHGGKDFGTVHNRYVEKKIVLSVALKVGKILENHPNIDVLYTRKRDVFIELMERTNIANKAKANFFVSIHCNGVKDSFPFGTETYVMGLTKNASNLEVAKRENEVITLESDYKLKYNGFDPDAPESMIGIKLLQEEYIDQSITLASKIQNKFKIALERKDRGVKQGPILVLNQSAMPSVLIELGFVSNKAEGAYLNSEEGQNALARGIADAIIAYKNEYFGNESNITAYEKEGNSESSIKRELESKGVASKKEESIVEKKTENRTEIDKVENKEVIFKVQISSGGKKIEPKPTNFKGLNMISFLHENGVYKYMYGKSNSYTTAKKKLQEAKAKGYDSSFIVAFKNGKKVSLKEALR